MEVFDGMLLLIIAIAMLSAKPPIRWMIFFCFICLAVMDAANALAFEGLISNNAIWRVTLSTEFTAGVVFVVWAHNESGYNRRFCQLMSYMFLISIFFNGQYYIGERSGYQTWSFERFKFISEELAVIHALIMLVFSDGIRNVLYTWWHSLSRRADR